MIKFIADDPTILEWAAMTNRVVLTHDIKTMVKYAYDRIDRDQPMPGVFAISQSAPIGQVIEDLLFPPMNRWAIIMRPSRARFCPVRDNQKIAQRFIAGKKVVV